jgi:hypothetical protein
MYGYFIRGKPFLKKYAFKQIENQTKLNVDISLQVRSYHRAGIALHYNSICGKSKDET